MNMVAAKPGDAGRSYFLHVGFNFRGTPRTPVEKLQPAFDSGLDWVRYGASGWIVYTNSSPQVWYDRLRPLIHDDDYMFICEISPSVRAGWLPQLVWEFLNKQR